MYSGVMIRMEKYMRLQVVCHYTEEKIPQSNMYLPAD